jgi:hypothetical protein
MKKAKKWPNHFISGKLFQKKANWQPCKEWAVFAVKTERRLYNCNRSVYQWRTQKFRNGVLNTKSTNIRPLFYKGM